MVMSGRAVSDWAGERRQRRAAPERAPACGELWLRREATAALAVSDPRDVLAQLDQVIWASYPSPLARQRLRAWARLDAEGREYTMWRELQRPEELVGVHALLDVAWATLFAGDEQRALNLLARVEARAPAHPEARYLSALQRATSASTQEHQEVARAIGLEPDDPVWLCDQSELLLGREQLAEAAQRLKQLSAPLEVSLIDRAGRLTERLGGALAEEVILGQLERYGEDDPGARAAWLRWLAVARGSRQGSSRASSALERALALEQADRAPLLAEQGRELFAAGQIQAARESFSSALRYNPSWAQAHLWLGELEALEMKRLSAETHLLRYLELRPYGAEAERATAQLDALRRQDEPPASEASAR